MSAAKEISPCGLAQRFGAKLAANHLADKVGADRMVTATSQALKLLGLRCGYRRNCSQWTARLEVARRNAELGHANHYEVRDGTVLSRFP